MGWTPRVGDPVLYKGDRGIVTDVVTHSSDADCSVGLDMGSKKLQTFSAVELTLHVEPGQWWESTKTGTQYVVEPEPQSPEPGLYRLRRLDTTQLLTAARSITELTSLLSGPDWKHVPADKSYKERVVPERGDVDEQPKWVPRLNDPVRSHDGKAGRVVKLGDWRVAVQWGGLDGFEWLPDASRLALDIAHGQWWENTSTKNVYRVTMARDGQQLVNLHSGSCIRLQGASCAAVVGEPNWMLVKDVDRGSLLASAAADSGAAALLRASSPSGEQPEQVPIPAPGQFWRRGAAVVELLQQADNEDGDAGYWVARYIASRAGDGASRIAQRISVDVNGEWAPLTPDEQRDVWLKTVQLLDDLNEYALGRGSATMPTAFVERAVVAALAEGRLRLREAGYSDAVLGAKSSWAGEVLRRSGNQTVNATMAALTVCDDWTPVRHEESWTRTVLGRYLRESLPELAKAAELACTIDSKIDAIDAARSGASSTNDAAIRFEAAGVARTPEVGDVYTRDGVHVRLTKHLDDGRWESETETAWVAGSEEDGFDVDLFGRPVVIVLNGWSYVPPADVAAMRRRSLTAIEGALAADIQASWEDRFPGYSALPRWTSGRQHRVFTDLAQRVWWASDKATHRHIVAVWAATARALEDAPSSSWPALRDRVAEAVRPLVLVKKANSLSDDSARDWANLVVGQIKRCPRGVPEPTEEKSMDVQEYARLLVQEASWMGCYVVRENIRAFAASLARRVPGCSVADEAALDIALCRALAIRIHALCTDGERPQIQALIEAALPHPTVDPVRPLMLDPKERAAILAFEERQAALQRAFDDARAVSVAGSLIEAVRAGQLTLPELEQRAGDNVRALAMVETFRQELQTNSKWNTKVQASEQEQEQETTMSKVKEQAGQAWDTLKDEGTEAAWNTVAIKAIDWGKGLVVGFAAKYIDPKDKTLKGKLTRALNTEGGAMVVSFALSGAVALFGSQVAPVLGIEQGRLSYLGERLRVMGMTKGGVAVVDGMLSQLKAKAGPLVMLLKAMPAMPSNGALPGGGVLRLSPDEAPVREKAR